MSESSIDFRTIGLVGCGPTGVALTELLVRSGRRVIAVESDPSAAERAQTAVFERLGADPADATAAPPQQADLVTFTARLEDLSAADLVVEAVTEDADVKASAFTAIADVVAPDTPVVTTAAYLSVTDLAALIPGAHRVAGLHLVNTAAATRTVEIVRGLDTGDELVARLVDLVGGLEGKEPVVVKDRPGFLVNALLVPFLNDVVQAYDEELATAADIDIALQLGLGYRTGPLEMLDQIGLDAHLHAAESLYAVTGDGRYAPPPLLRRMVAAGRLGAKNGNGFRCGSRTDS